MSGCYPRRIGFDSFEGDWVLFPGHSVGMSDDEVTVTELLKDQGYATKLVGKWHCGDQPEFLPTLADLAGTSEPGDRIIDGHNIQPLMKNEPDAESPYDVFYFYRTDTLEAVRSGRWKLHVSKGGEDVEELYYLREDIGETNNVAADNRVVVKRLQKALDTARYDLGDGAQNMDGENRRPIGRVENAEPLTSYDEDHPYIIAEYDLTDCG